MKRFACLMLPVCLSATGLSAQVRPAGHAADGHKSTIQYGTASYYADRFQGKPTASGTLYDKNQMTCANNSFPMGTLLRITNVRNKRSVVVRVIDRLHRNNDRLVDLSWAAAAKLGYVKRGLAPVKLQVLSKKAVLTKVNTR